MEETRIQCYYDDMFLMLQGLIIWKANSLERLLLRLCLMKHTVSSHWEPMTQHYFRISPEVGPITVSKSVTSGLRWIICVLNL